MNDGKERNNLSRAEWKLMESLWDSAPKIGSRIVDDLKKSVGWSRSTTLTMLRRMSDKGVIACRNIKGLNAYFPLLDRETAVRKQSEEFLSRVYGGDVSLMIRSYVENYALSKEQMDEIYTILRKAEENRH